MASYLERLKDAVKKGEMVNTLKKKHEKEVVEQNRLYLRHRFELAVGVNINKMEQCFASGEQDCGFELEYKGLDACNITRELLGMSTEPEEVVCREGTCYNLGYIDMKPRKGYQGLKYLPTFLSGDKPYGPYEKCYVQVLP